MLAVQDRRAQQLWQKEASGPSAAERSILAAIKRSAGLRVSYRRGTPLFTLGNGTPVTPLGSFDLPAAIELGWLYPDPDAPALLPGCWAQRYLVADRVVFERESA